MTDHAVVSLVSRVELREAGGVRQTRPPGFPLRGAQSARRGPRRAHTRHRDPAAGARTRLIDAIDENTAKVMLRVPRRVPVVTQSRGWVSVNPRSGHRFDEG